MKKNHNSQQRNINYQPFIQQTQQQHHTQQKQQQHHIQQLHQIQLNSFHNHINHYTLSNTNQSIKHTLLNQSSPNHYTEPQHIHNQQPFLSTINQNHFHSLQQQSNKSFFYKLFNFKCFIISISIIFIILLSLLIYLQITIFNQSKAINTTPDQIYDKITLNSTSALCLDGSPGAYYISRTGNPANILIYFSGGAWCGQDTIQNTLENCYQRTYNSMGSSQYLESTRIFSNNMLAKNDQNYFKEWKKIFIPYCDGSGHQGTRKQPVQYKDKLLYFRGHNLTVQKFDDINKRLGLFSQSQKVVLTGDSAGGLATLTWANYLSQKLHTDKFWAIQDAGIFYDSMNKNTKTHLFKEKMKNMMNFANIQIDHPVSECVKQFVIQKQNCMFAQNLYKYIKVPLFAIQSFYDIYSLPNIIGVDCIYSLSECSHQDRSLIQQNRVNVTNVLRQISINGKNGVWGVSCVHHETILGSRYINYRLTVPQYSRYTISESIREWIQNPEGNNIHIDQQSDPYKRNCI